MITRNTDYSIQHLRGLSTDTKPTDVPNGSEFREMDTGKKFLYSAAGTEWIEQQGSGGGSGGGGSVEPLIVEIGAVDGQDGTFMKAQAKSIYDAFSAGTPVRLNNVLGQVYNLLDATTPNNTRYVFHYLVIGQKSLENKEFISATPTDFPKLRTTDGDVTQ